jgi:hypothetical protein
MTLRSIGISHASMEKSVDIVLHQHKLTKLTKLIERNQSITNMQGK